MRSIALVALFVVALCTRVSAADANTTRCFSSAAAAWNNGTSSAVSFYGCFLASTLNVSVPATSAVANFTNLTAFTVPCGAECLNTSVSEDHVAQFVILRDGSCRCVSPSHFLTARVNANISVACPAPRSGGDEFVWLFEAAPQCPQNVSACHTVRGCTPRGGCCVYSPAAERKMPTLYQSMVQWAILMIIVLAIVEAVLYGCLRYRARRRMADFEGDAILRTKDDANQLSTRLLDTFTPVPNTSLLSCTSPEACVICLDDLTTMPSVKLPCDHVLHTTCLREYMAHKLESHNHVGCPTCRAPIAEAP